MIGFQASALVRLAAGAAFCVCAVALVWWVERAPPAAPAVQTGAQPTQRSLRLAVESTYPVAGWTVLVLGDEQKATSSDAYGWQGLISAPAGEEVVVIAPAAPAAEAPNRGLRLRLGDKPERIVWGAGDVVGTETVP